MIDHGQEKRPDNIKKKPWANILAKKTDKHIIKNIKLQKNVWEGTNVMNSDNVFVCINDPNHAVRYYGLTVLCSAHTMNIM